MRELIAIYLCPVCKLRKFIPIHPDGDWPRMSCLRCLNGEMMEPESRVESGPAVIWHEVTVPLGAVDTWREVTEPSRP